LSSEVEVLPRITEYGDLVWTPKETQRLLNNYRHATKNTLEKIFPDRTYVAIQCKANRMRLSKRTKYTPWSDEELSLLKTFQGSILTFRELAEYFPIRTEAAIRSKFNKLNLTKLNKPRWLNVDITLLKKLYSDPSNSVEEIHAKLKGSHSINAIRLKVSRLGIKREWGSLIG